ncbi:MAG: SRPBCC family protein [Opitutales bacterium]
MSSYSVERSVLVGAPASAVFARVRDFRQWPEWSPWLRAEPEAKLTFADDGTSYAWEGDVVGSGSITRVEERTDEQLVMRLQFLKPFRSVATTTLAFASEGAQTRIAWRMEGAMPWFLFWMIPMMKGWIAMDYDNGLAMLKDLAETGVVPLKLTFRGVKPYPSATCLMIDAEGGPADSVGEAMRPVMEQLGPHLRAPATAPAGAPFTVYREFAPAKNHCAFTVGYPLASSPAEPPEGARIVERPAGRAYLLEMVGPYRHLGTAWSAAMAHQRAKKFKADAKVPPFEIYENDPETTAEHELLTRIHLPAK